MLSRTASTACSPSSSPAAAAASISGRQAPPSKKNSFTSLFCRRRNRRRGNRFPTSASSSSSSSSSAFRPCIDIHKGKVKQIVGSTLSDLDKASSSAPVTNFESSLPPSHYSKLYRDNHLPGGHVIMLGADEGSRKAAEEALSAWPGGLHVGGGVSAANARRWLDAGASHVIVTSAVFRDGKLDEGALAELVGLVGRERLVLDLSCRKKKKKEKDSSSSSPSSPSPLEDSDDPYFVVTDRWQKYSDLRVDARTLESLSLSCSEFLVHAVDVEGKSAGIDVELIEILGKNSPIPVTYAGGASTIADLEKVAVAGGGRVDVTVGSALDIFGGGLAFDDVVEWSRREGERRKKQEKSL